MLIFLRDTRKQHPSRALCRSFMRSTRDRLVYGTDMGFDKSMYRVTFRILETLDEHFYETDMFGYHWSLNGFGLSDEILQKVYQANAKKILSSRGTQAHA